VIVAMVNDVIAAVDRQATIDEVMTWSDTDVALHRTRSATGRSSADAPGMSPAPDGPASHDLEAFRPKAVGVVPQTDRT
jgi:hypothetical protein